MINLIVKDNALIEASHRLGEVEQRLILLAILKARSQCSTIEQLQGKTLIIHADDYIQTFNVDKSTAYRVLKEGKIFGEFSIFNDKINKNIEKFKSIDKEYKK